MCAREEVLLIVIYKYFYYCFKFMENVYLFLLNLHFLMTKAGKTSYHNSGLNIIPVIVKEAHIKVFKFSLIHPISQHFLPIKANITGHHNSVGM